jgi:hypothetical protein
MADDTIRTDDNIQHGIDDDPNNDPQKGAVLGGVGGAAVGAAAGSLAGPAGTAIGAVAGGIAGAVGSGAAVAGVDAVDNDNKMSGIGDGVDVDRDLDDEARDLTVDTTDTVYDRDLVPGNDVPGIQTGGHDIDGTPDTRGIMEKTADTLTGDRIDDKTGKPV